MMMDPFRKAPELAGQHVDAKYGLILSGSIVLLTIFAVAGCNDSHSDEFKEFKQAEFLTGDTDEPADASAETEPVQADATTDENVSSPPVKEDEPEVPVTPEPAPADKPEEPAPEGSETPPAETNEPPDTPSAQPIKLLIPHRNFRQEGTALRASFDDIDLLKVLNMDPVPMDAADHFPKWLSELNGKRVRIRGYMRPGFEIEDITEFLFVRDNGECCYGPLPKIYDMIAVQLADGESTDLIEGTPFDVEGILRIEPHVDEIELYGLFFIDDGVIIE